MHHAGETQIVDVFRLARNLFAAFFARNGPSNQGRIDAEPVADVYTLHAARCMDSHVILK